jgi:hypothetical protein
MSCTLTGRGPKDAAKAVVKLVSSANLGELSSLEEIFKMLCLGPGGGGGGGPEAPASSSFATGASLSSGRGSGPAAVGEGGGWEPLLQRETLAYVCRHLANGNEAGSHQVGPLGRWRG